MKQSNKIIIGSTQSVKVETSAKCGDPAAMFKLAEKYGKDTKNRKSRHKSFYWFKKAAEAGYVPAYDVIGNYYLNGDGVRQDYQQAAKWFKKSAQEKDVLGLIDYGYVLYNGLGVRKNYQKAFNLYFDASKMGNLFASYKLGRCYYYGRGVKKNYSKALKLFLISDPENVEASYFIGKIYSHQLKNDKEAFIWYKKGALAGVADCFNLVGEFYRDGDVVKRNLKESVKWFKLAAKANDDDGLLSLGYATFYGKGTKKDQKKAIKYYMASAKQGNVRANCNLGLCYRNGTGVKQDYKRSYQYFLAAYKFDHPTSQFKIAEMYEYGLGVKVNKSLAKKWYLKRPEINDMEALFSVGVLSHNLKEYDDAVRYYRKAAKLGHYKATYYLGDCFKRGTGVKKSKHWADYWFKKAKEIKASKKTIGE